MIVGDGKEMRSFKAFLLCLGFVRLLNLNLLHMTIIVSIIYKRKLVFVTIQSMSLFVRLKVCCHV